MFNRGNNFNFLLVIFITLFISLTGCVGGEPPTPAPPVYDLQPFTLDRLTHEFDVCRMLDGNFTVGE